MNKLASLVSAFALTLASLPGVAQAFDGTQPLICSTLETQDCELGGDCIKGLARDIDAPQFIQLDFEKGLAHTIRAEGEERTAEIAAASVGESGVLTLQGVQLGRAWSATISQESGEMILVVAGDGVAFVVFGVCTPM